MFNRVDYRKVKKVESDGRSYDSKLEKALYDYLKMLEAAKEISDIKQQVNVHLTAARILFKVDYSYLNNATGDTEYAESKGFVTPVYAIKRRLWAKYGPGKLHVYKGSHKNMYLDETIIPKLEAA